MTHRATWQAEKQHIASALASLGAAEVARRLSLSGMKHGNREQQASGVLVRCPSHDDSTASLSITRGPDRLLRVRCFGCPLAGDAFTLIAAVHGLEPRTQFSTVLDHARALVGSGIVQARTLYVRDVRENGPAPLDDDTFDRLVRWLLDKCPIEKSIDGTAYLQGRGLLELVGRKFGCLPALPLQPELIAALCSELGEHVWQRSGLVHPHIATRFLWGENRLLIPWRHAGVDGLIANLQRRALGPVTRGPKYVAASFRTFPAPFGIEDALEELVDATAALVIVEGAIDTVVARSVFAEKGIHVGVVGIPGCQGWRESWARFGKGRAVKIGTDADEAGDRAAVQIAADLHAAGASNVTRIRLLQAHDWAEMVAS